MPATESGKKTVRGPLLSSKTRRERVSKKYYLRKKGLRLGTKISGSLRKGGLSEPVYLANLESVPLSQKVGGGPVNCAKDPVSVPLSPRGAVSKKTKNPHREQ